MRHSASSISEKQAKLLAAKLQRRMERAAEKS
jgi:hypothetical protein